MNNHFAGVLFIVSLLHPAASAFAQEPNMERAQALLQPFKTGLMAALKAGLQQGPVEAIAACNIQAPAIAANLSREEFRVGRSSHRLRNSFNTAPEWAAPSLNEYANGGDLKPELVPLGNGHWGYVEPITLQPLCTTCHGETLAAPVEERIRELYPNDQATGFKPGEFRGIFWMEFTEDGDRPDSGL